MLLIKLILISNNNLKLTLGTVQFGIQYGISNTSGIPSDLALKEILQEAQVQGITKLDTAYAYGNAEDRLGFLVENRFKIITKFPILTTSDALRTSFEDSLSRLQQNSIYGYLAHNADVLLQNPDLWTVLQEFKADGKVAEIGYSLYQPEQLEQLLDLQCVPDLVQLPFSVLDRKFQEYLPQLKALGTEIHVRSVFLQGLYFMNPQSLPEKLHSLAPALTQFQALCKEANCTVGDAALNYAVTNPYIDEVVIGVENASQLRDNCTSIKNWQPVPDLILALEALEVEDKNLLNPANW